VIRNVARRAQNPLREGKFSKRWQPDHAVGNHWESILALARLGRFSRFRLHLAYTTGPLLVWSKTPAW
jgi:hypothetical protein